LYFPALSINTATIGHIVGRIDIIMLHARALKTCKCSGKWKFNDQTFLLLTFQFIHVLEVLMIVINVSELEIDCFHICASNIPPSASRRDSY